MLSPDVPTIVIHIKDNFIQGVVSNSPAKIIVLNADRANNNTLKIPGYQNVQVEQIEAAIDKQTINDILKYVTK